MWFFFFSLLQLLKRLGHPLDEKTLYGPLHNKTAVEAYKHTIEEAQKAGGKILVGGRVLNRPGFYVEPTIITDIAHDAKIVKTETFAPIVYILKAKSLEQVRFGEIKIKYDLNSIPLSRPSNGIMKWTKDCPLPCSHETLDQCSSGSGTAARTVEL